ncbi:MAG: hypothetical protein V3U28_11190, partial [Candidatus Acidoferrales bacterium]
QFLQKKLFERYEPAKRGRPIKSLLYCVVAVAQVAEAAREAAAGRAPSAPAAERPSGFDPGEVGNYFRANAAALRAAALRAAAQRASPNAALAQAFADIAAALEALAEQPATASTRNLEDLERHLTVFEEKLLGALTQATSADELVELRRDLERSLAPYRRRMKAAQLALIESQFLQKKLFERYALPRLSLFYLPASDPTRGAPTVSKEET